MARSAWIVGAVFAVALGCGASDGHPAPAGEGSSEQFVHASLTLETCEPGSSRPCHRYFYDDQGQLHCPLEEAFCRNDGLGYYDCGMYGRDADGGLVPRFPDAGGIEPR